MGLKEGPLYQRRGAMVMPASLAPNTAVDFLSDKPIDIELRGGCWSWMARPLPSMWTVRRRCKGWGNRNGGETRRFIISHERLITLCSSNLWI